MNKQISHIIAAELKVKPEQVLSAIMLLDDGATVPFIARYRKEVTNNLDDNQLRELETRLSYLRELEERKHTILNSIREQGKLTEELEKSIEQTGSKTELEDLYLPYKPKRRTRGQIAIEAGLEPLAEILWTDDSCDPESVATKYINKEKGIEENKAALDGARYILMERFAEDAALLAKIRHYLIQNAELVSKVIEGKETEGAKFKDYFEYHEAITKIPSHRALAVFRGRNEGILHLSLNADPQLEEESQIKASYCEQIIAQHLQLHLTSLQGKNSALARWRQQVVSWTWRIKILMHMETELMSTLREKAETEAINVFARNLKDLLLSAPAGSKATMGLDPGLRTGVKIAVVDQTGKLLATDTIYPHTGQTVQAAKSLAELCVKHNVELVAIGNGTASRETEQFFLETQKKYSQIKAQKVIVSEAGASIYSASELAAKEFPQLDVSLRGAVSIARRLQDPLAELVKIDPKSIGVGQYQHDVSQTQLAKKLDAVVEDCVNHVGVDLNTASVSLLTRVSGLTTTLAQNIVDWRENNGRFNNRKQLLSVNRLGPKAFEQSAGFLRIIDGDNALDASAVHPESYVVVEKILQKTAKPLTDVMGNSTLIKSLHASDFIDQQTGLSTVSDILKELDKPGRDPRPEFKTAQFAEGINTLNDLKVGMVLEGTVTNVTNFGAFVDIGVHQDGLVHISLLSDQFVEDPHQVVKAGDIVKVKVMDCDIARKRIALSMRLNEEKSKQTETKSASSVSSSAPKQKAPPSASSAMGDAFRSALNQLKK